MVMVQDSPLRIQCVQSVQRKAGHGACYDWLQDCASQVMHPPFVSLLVGPSLHSPATL